MTYSLNWDLDPIYPGGIESPEFADKLLLLAHQITDLKNNVAAYDVKEDEDFSGFAKLVDDNQVIFSGLRTAALFVNALSAADYTNPAYRPYQTKVSELDVAYQAALNAFAKLLTTFSDAAFKQAVAEKDVAPVAFYLNELR